MRKIEAEEEELREIERCGRGRTVRKREAKEEEL